MRVISDHDSGRHRRRHRRRRLRSLEFLPTLITLGNLLCGFAAIHFAMRNSVDGRWLMYLLDGQSVKGSGIVAMSTDAADVCRAMGAA